ncbi:MAG TPA: signal peptide peptidase SppA [Candidatus Obscuribacterales bacterium]
MQVNQRWFVWIILLLCVAAIPIGFVGRKSGAARLKDDDVSPFSSSTYKYVDHIQVIKLSGMIVDKPDPLISAGASAISCVKQLRKAAKDEHVKAVLLRINSPGGTVSTSQELNEAVSLLREKGKIVYSSMSDLAASGGYYVACATDRIYAQPGTLTGSIGVILSLVNVKGLADKLGLQPEVIKSGQFKDIASPYRAMTPQERQLLQNLIMDSYDQFVTAVAKGRKMKVDDVKKIADGRIYSGRQAKQLGLVDELGSYDDALDALQKACMEKFQLKEELPVNDKPAGGLLSQIAQLTESMAPAKPSLCAESFILPDFMRGQFYKQPLWLMQ